jgi:dihydrofolate reductase
LAKVIVGMTISLDGFVADQNGNAGRLYPDLAALRHTAYMKDVIEQAGAVLMGRRTFEMGDPDSYVGNYEFQVPIFVLTHHPPSVAPKQDEHLTFTFVTDSVKSAVAQAKAAARDKEVQVVGGVSVARQLLDAGLVDELHVDISQLPGPKNWAMAGGSNGYRATLVSRQLTPGLISSLPGTAGLPPFISFSTSYPELPFTSASDSQGVSLS